MWVNNFFGISSVSEGVLCFSLRPFASFILWTLGTPFDESGATAEMRGHPIFKLCVEKSHSYSCHSSMYQGAGNHFRPLKLQFWCV